MLNDSIPYEQQVRPDMKRAVRNARRRSLACAIAVIAGVVIFSVSMFFLNGAYKTFGGIGVGIGAGLCVLGAIVGFMIRSHTTVLGLILDLIEKIEASEHVELTELELPEADEKQVVMVIRMLLLKGNLPDYELNSDETAVLRKGTVSSSEDSE